MLLSVPSQPSPRPSAHGSTGVMVLPSLFPSSGVVPSSGFVPVSGLVPVSGVVPAPVEDDVPLACHVEVFVRSTVLIEAPRS